MKKKSIKEKSMPYSCKCVNKACQQAFDTHVRWKPPGSTWFIECPKCEYVNKRQIKRSDLDSWFHTTHDMKIRLVTEAIEDVVNILGHIKSIPDEHKQRLHEIEVNMQIVNQATITPKGNTDDDIEFG